MTYIEALNNQEEYFRQYQNMLYGISEQYADNILARCL